MGIFASHGINADFMLLGRIIASSYELDLIFLDKLKVSFKLILPCCDGDLIVLFTSDIRCEIGNDHEGAITSIMVSGDRFLIAFIKDCDITISPTHDGPIISSFLFPLVNDLI